MAITRQERIDRIRSLAKEQGICLPELKGCSPMALALLQLQLEQRALYHEALTKEFHLDKERVV